MFSKEGEVEGKEGEAEGTKRRRGLQWVFITLGMRG
jgi:hypothetical protein